jgi:hypothetical protein
MQIFGIEYAIIKIYTDLVDMSSFACSSCAVVLNQQQMQNTSHQNQLQDNSVDDRKSVNKTCTVVENGRVVVKPLQPQNDEAADKA